MKFAFLIGGCVGFVLVAAGGLSAGRAPDLILRDAAIACLAGAFLFRWFWSVVVKAWADTLQTRRAAAEAAATATEPAPGARLPRSQ